MELFISTEREQFRLREFAEGRYEPSLLFNDSAILKRISDHPVALWKLESIRQAQRQRQEQQFR